MLQKNSIYSLVFTMFNVALGWGIVLTLFAPLLLNSPNQLLPQSASVHMEYIVLGLLIGCYPLMQFFFLPIIGAISDRVGRKKVLSWTILCAGLSFGLSAIAISISSLTLLFISRILSGIFSANGATAQAAIADMSSEQEKGKNLSFTGIAGGLAWVVGPPLGGLLSTKAYFPWVDFSTPFWFVMVLFFINFIWVNHSFEETYLVHHREKHDWKQEIKNFSKLSKIDDLSIWLLIALFFFLGWGFYILFYPTLLIERFHFDQMSIGIISGYFSFFWLVTSILMRKVLADRLKPQTYVFLGLPIAGLLSITLAFVPSVSWWYGIFPFMAFCGSSIWISILAILSNIAGKENQGKIFGVSQSLLSLALCISPMISGPLAAIDEKVPLTISGIILIAVGILGSFHTKGQRSKD